MKVNEEKEDIITITSTIDICVYLIPLYYYGGISSLLVIFHILCKKCKNNLHFRMKYCKISNVNYWILNFFARG